MIKRVNKFVFALVLSVCILFLSSCSYLVTGFFYVRNNTKNDVTDFIIKWELNGETDYYTLDVIPAGTRSDDYAVILNNVRANLFNSFTSEFTVSYTLNGKEYSVVNCKTKETDKDGNVKDPRAYFLSDKFVTIDIFDVDYIIMHE